MTPSKYKGSFKGRLRMALFLSIGILFLPALSHAQLNKVKSKLTGEPTSKEKQALSHEQIRHEVMRFGDEYILRLSNALKDIIELNDDPEIEKWAKRMMLSNGTSVFQIGAGDRPHINVLDMLVMVTLTRAEFANYWMGVYGEDIQPAVDVLELLEADIWEVVRPALTDEQASQLKNLLSKWIAENPNIRQTSFIRFREFTSFMEQKEESSQGPGSIFSLLYLDPLAGLDPTVRVIEESKLFGERLLTS
ncbi:MAG: hypothetical protein AAGC73_06995, partial [Verrucomicrobiota bacterium]